MIGAGEGIRTLDPNLGKSRSDVLLFIYNNLFCDLKSEHDPKMALPSSTNLLFHYHKGEM
jgi:hypothetical protein